MSTDDTTPDTRAEYTAGLRALADLLDANPQLCLPSHGGQWLPMTILVTRSEVQRADLAAWARALPGRKSKKDDGTEGQYLSLCATLHGIHIKVIADRDEVCERVVTGTREVSEEVPDPEALAAVPKVTVTKTVEDVEWVCRPLLADDAELQTTAVAA